MRVSLLTLLCLGTALLCHGQMAQKIQYGIKTGINYNKLKGSKFESSLQSDWHLGGYIQLRGQKLGVGVETIFDRGTYELKNLIVDAYNYKYMGDTSTNNAMLRVHKFQLPIYLLYKFSIFDLMAGMVYELNLDLKDRQKMIRDVEDCFQNSYPSGLLGVWLDVTPKVSVGARYQISLQNINSENLSTRWRSREIQLHLGIGLGGL